MGYGVVFFEILARQLPFQEVNQRQLPKAKFDGVLPVIAKSVAADFGQLITSCCACKPSSRPSMRGVVARLHEFADGRKIIYDEVKMPSWGQSSSSGGDAGDNTVALEELRRRREKLDEVRQGLQRELEERRERRKRVQEAYLGKGITLEEIEPLKNTADGLRNLAATGGATDAQ